MKLTEEDLELIKYSPLSVKRHLSIGDYYVKKAAFNFTAYNELIGEKIAHIFGINCPKCYVVMIDGDNYILSEDLNKFGDFQTFKDMGIYKTEVSLYAIWNDLETKFGRSFKEVLDVVKVYIFDIMLSQYDRHAQNIGMLFMPDGNRKITILDNELMFNYEMSAITSYYDVKEFEEGIDNVSELEHFLSESSSEYIDLFKYYFELLTLEYFEELLLEIEQEQNVKFDIESRVDYYRKSYAKLAEVLNKNLGGRKV